MFTSYFCVYLYSRTQDEAAFLEAQSALTLPARDPRHDPPADQLVGDRPLRPARPRRQVRVAQRFAVATAGLGVAFLALKLVEWVALIGDGHTFTSSDFMQYFFFLTGMHAIHLLIGFVVLGVLVHQLADPQRRSPTTIETCTTYWHTVDLFWVLIFALLYIVR